MKTLPLIDNPQHFSTNRVQAPRLSRVDEDSLWYLPAIACPLYSDTFARNDF